MTDDLRKALEAERDTLLKTNEDIAAKSKANNFQLRKINAMLRGDESREIPFLAAKEGANAER